MSAGRSAEGAQSPAGPIALLTPMANPTVEREMRALLPPSCDYVVGRLVSRSGEAEERLRAYATDIASTLKQFGGMPLSAVAFACTGSSYLIGRSGERQVEEGLEMPVYWAAREIETQLRRLGARRIAVVSPYPETLHLAGLGYWRDAGFEIVNDRRVEIGSSDTRQIYALTGREAELPVAAARRSRPDAILLSGTGMPSLALIDPRGSPPVVSSNWCLAQAMLAGPAGRQGPLGD